MLNRKNTPANGASEVQATAIINALPHPVLLVDEDMSIITANDSAQSFFQASLSSLRKHGLSYFVPFGSPVLALIDEVVRRGTPVNGYRVDISSPRIGSERIVDIHAAPLINRQPGTVVMLQERSMADKIDRQLTHRGAARSVMGLASMLAHEIKNPLSGIRGAAQLLEQSVGDEDRALTQLITAEADRIVKLVDRMDVFSDERPVERAPVNIHVVLDRVKRVATTGFARDVTIREDYDPSLPPVWANSDQLIQVFLNLIKNACEAVKDRPDGEIELSTAFRPGIRLSVPGSAEKVSLPLEFCVKDNGPGVSEDLLPHLFDPFVTTKTNGTGLGLALVAKIVGDHGGVIECDMKSGMTVFRILLPAFTPATAGDAGDTQ
ncbi:two-component system nitrogen regulation sensor histidine kinase GlnL [Rhodobium orientis]|uniref:histidine kinase n=1 Tax=Rhodobium orientis TaxID=34017 RepID=A0A327JT51_9HYPH|nr:nitrogen regulation protein NR(II) [Rhodobium orientis]MBB4302468.1 two-component system nitrogen regulation sensor histidine kinase GlnL [Rhodobium orientis]MBK5949317.1 two-component sensor histidine kinase [Rhodobium orientis]RAI28633.1 two-component sensor histidine kinase [Rhodobium orientis]